jgi:hypothetical protein
MLRALVVFAALTTFAGATRADTLPLLGVPAGYTPGQAFSFDIYAPGLVGLTDYTLQFSVTAGSPPNLPDLTVQVDPAASAYPFPDTSNFATSQSVVAGVNSIFVTVSDATSGSGVNTLSGVNDHLATVSISPGVNLSGPITISFMQNDFTTSRDVGFDLPPPIVIPELPSGPNPEPVPAPPGVVLAGVAGLCLAARSLRGKKGAIPAA